jgi:hypothetical protein
MIVLSEVPNMPTEPGPISFKAGAGHGDRKYPGLMWFPANCGQSP